MDVAWALGPLCHNTMPVVVDESMKAVRVVYEKVVQETGARTSEDGEDGLSFHPVSGLRLRRLQKLMASGTSATAVAIFMAFGEVGHSIGFYFMQAAEGRLSNGGPFVMDLVQPSTSPIVVLEQYLAS